MASMVELTRKHLSLCKTPEEAERLLVLNEENIRLVTERILICEGTIGEKRRLENELGQLKGLLTEIKNKIKVGRGLKGEEIPRVEWLEVESAFKGRLRTGVIANNTIEDPGEFFEAALEIFRLRIREAINQKMPSVKVNVVLCGDYIKPHDPDLRSRKYFCTKNFAINKSSDVAKIFHEIKAGVLTQMEEFETEGSGWVLERVVNLAVNVSKYQPLSASGYINLPPSIAAKRAVVNVKNLDDKCFIYALLSALYPVQRDANRVSSYPQNLGEIFNFRDITLPMKINDISKFERLNPTISINVFGLKKGEVVGPLYHTREKKNRHVNLLYLSEKGKRKNHYCWIKDLARLCTSQFTRNVHKHFICDRCLAHFSVERRLVSHSEDCSRVDPVKVTLPSNEESELSFKNFRFDLRQPFVVYADFECLVEPLDEGEEDDEGDVRTSHTRAYQKHTPYAVGYQVVCSFDDSLSHYNSYRGPNPQKWFVDQLQRETLVIEQRLSDTQAMLPLTPKQLEEFNNETSCKHCLKQFDVSNVIKCRDHDHISGEYRSALCADCNLNYTLGKHIPIIMHNLSGYDMHFIITELDFNQSPIEVLPITMENYISVSKKCGKYTWRFIDSFRFLNASLASLAQNLPSEMFKATKEAFPGNFKLMTRKGIFCYDYLDSWEKLNETRLPSLSEFYNKLTEETVSSEDYVHAQTVWDTFNIRTLGEYSEVYLKSDVKILCDVFEQFRDLCLSVYGIDAAHCYTSPGLAWQAALKKTRVKLELLTDRDKILFVEKGIRGGLTQCSHRYAQANNEYMEKYDPSRAPSYLYYVDANNLYGYAMGQPLPYKGFQWVSEEGVAHVERKLKNLKFEENVKFSDYDDRSCMSYLSEDGRVGEDISLFLEVDLTYPSDIHDKHSEFPFCPEHIFPPGSKNLKLMATTRDKKKYVIHLRNLIQCLMHGLKLEKIYRILKFETCDWLKTYIDMNTDLRSKAKNDFEKNFYKLMNNSVFGKTMENIRKHRVVKLVTSWKIARKLIARPNFKSFSIFKRSRRKTLVAIELNKTSLKYNKPVYLGMSILDLSKLLMYSFHHEFIENITTRPHRLLYMDTDSFMYSFEDDIYSLVSGETEKGPECPFDTSNYPYDNRYGIARVNNQVLGKFKDELKGKVFTEFVGLRAKMYAVKVDGEEKPVKKAKGVPRTAVKNRLTFDSFYNALFSNETAYVTGNTIRSIKHEVFTFNIKKKALDPLDDKRCILRDGISTLPWGHYKMEERSLDNLVEIAKYFVQK